MVECYDDIFMKKGEFFCPLMTNLFLCIVQDPAQMKAMMRNKKVKFHMFQEMGRFFDTVQAINFMIMQALTSTRE